MSNPYDELDARERHARLRRGGHDEYLLYLRSTAWRALRTRLIRERGGACERCGRSYLVVLDVHHRYYVRLGCELDRDLEVLCRPCHELRDQTRRTVRNRRWQQHIDREGTWLSSQPS